MPHTALAGRSGCVQQEPAEVLCGGYPQEGRGNARVSVRTGVSRQRKNRARVAEGSKGRARPKKGDATLQNATAGGQKFGLLALKGKMQNPIPLESHQVCFSHRIWRIRFLSSV